MIRLNQSTVEVQFLIIEPTRFRSLSSGGTAVVGRWRGAVVEERNIVLHPTRSLCRMYYFYLSACLSPCGSVARDGTLTANNLSLLSLHSPTHRAWAPADVYSYLGSAGMPRVDSSEREWSQYNFEERKTSYVECPRPDKTHRDRRGFQFRRSFR